MKTARFLAIFACLGVRIYPNTSTMRKRVCRKLTCLRCVLVYFNLPLALLAICASAEAGPAAYLDRTFDSQVFGTERQYRLFLPADYDSSEKRYPVIYYCHGHSDRYTLSKYDDGKDTVPKIARFVAQNDVIVVAVDGYVEEHYEGFYGGYPWDVLREGGDYDFGDYFLEMVAHVDATYRTLTTRRSRAISGLSMGGYMSLRLSARYPELLGSASAFNPGPEFFTGDKGRRMLWRPKDHVSCHAHTKVRLIRASGDYISQYHEETRDAYARANEVDFEYCVDEYHRHWATSIGETFAFHMRALEDPRLDEIPSRWSYTSAHRQFEAWGYEVQVTPNEQPSEQGEKGRGLVYLTDVEASGLRVTTRRWAPDGPPVKGIKIRILTAPVYRPGEVYQVTDLNFATGEGKPTATRADEEGRLEIRINGGGHQLGIVGPGIVPPRLVLLPITTKDKLRLWPNVSQSLPIRIYNPGAEPIANVRVVLSSNYPTVELQDPTARFAELGSGEVADAEESIQVRFATGADHFAPTRLNVTFSADGQTAQTFPIDVLVIPDSLPPPMEVKILDGRTATFTVFRQKGNQGGGKAIERTVTEGQGNGDGKLQPGEEATLWVKLAQGLDPLDKGNWSRAKVFTDSRWITEAQDIQELKQREWTGAKSRTSVVRVANETPPGTMLSLLLDNETWSFHYTPEVRYGKERLYQAFQRHQHHLHRLEVEVGK